MNKTQLHLVGGFLGSGKTTAIIQTCKSLMKQGLSVGVITNDQGKYLVDTAFYQFGDIPALEVTGGCYCCNYDDLNDRLDLLIGTAQPDMIFAESVGSCADLVATVLKPLLLLGTTNVKPHSFSVFADIRLMRLLLAGEELPFSENVNYVFEKQIEETRLLVINKQDLLAPEKLPGLLNEARQRYPEKEIMLQSSLTQDGVRPWLNRIQSNELVIPVPVLEIDYQRYGDGEAELAWLDETISLNGVGTRNALVAWLNGVLNALDDIQAPIGHLKLILCPESGGQSKLSITTPVTSGWQADIPAFDGNLKVLLNARVEMDADDLRDLIGHYLENATRNTRVAFQVESLEAFHPGFPHPTHRIQS